VNLKNLELSFKFHLVRLLRPQDSVTPRDLGRIGAMMADRGLWGGKRIVPADWVDKSTTQWVSVDELRRYGYQWYLGDLAFGKPRGWSPGHLERAWSCVGEGGQRLFVFEGLKLVVAITAGDYGAEDQWIPPTRLLREVILASLSS
jgi:CubicO group peptidase (beta-lactamase class C family)